MKLTLGLLLLLIVQGWAINSYSQKVVVNLDLKDVDIIRVLDEIENQTDYYFLFNYEQIQSDKKIDVKLSNSKIDEVLNKILEGTGLNYSIKNRQIVISKDASDRLNQQISSTSVQQLTSVSGKVTDSTGSPLPGVSVVVKGTTTGTITDADGNYSLPNVPENAKLQFSFVGMKGQEVPVAGKTSINVKMEEETVGIDEVVAIGYGSVKRKDLTGAVVSIDAGLLEKVKPISFEAGLSARATGVQITSSQGGPGAGAKVRIRGGTSINASNDPLYVIDGVAIEGSSINTSVGLGNSTTSPLTSLDPSFIESVDVLKDASATAIYGSRGANGVVIITTKKGKGGKAEMNFETYQSIGTIVRPIKLLSGQQFVDYWNEFFPYNPSNPRDQYGRAYRDEFGNVYPLKNSASIATDWQKEITRPAKSQYYALSLKGGSDKSNYAGSFSYTKQEGIVKSSDFQRLSGSFHLDQNISEKLKAGANVNIGYTNNNGIVSASSENAGGRSGVITSALLFNPVQGATKYSDAEYDSNGRLISVRNGDVIRPDLLIQKDYNNSISFQSFGNAYVSYKITKYLSFQSSLRGNIYYSKGKAYYSEEIGWGKTGNGRAFTNFGQSTGLTTEQRLTYNKMLGEHSINVVAVYEQQKSSWESLNASSLNFAIPGVNLDQMGAAVTTQTTQSDKVTNSLSSYLGRVNYSYRDKYLLTVSGRYDGSSRFAEGKKWGFFPSAALSWKISNENFLKDNKIISNAKAKISYGETGNTAIGSYRSLGALGLASYIFEGSKLTTGLSTNRLPNPDLTWETTSQMDGGLLIGLFKDRISLELDYYDKITKNLLLEVPLPANSGYEFSFKNLGKVRNNGLEIGLNTVNIDKTNFKWTSNFNISFQKNKIVDMGRAKDFYITAIGDNQIRNDYVVRKGESLGSFYGLKQIGVYNYSDFVEFDGMTDAQAAEKMRTDLIAQNAKNNTPGNGWWTLYYTLKDGVQTSSFVPNKLYRPGLPKFENQNPGTGEGKDNNVNSDDRTIIGNALPKHFGGFTNNFSYKNFDLTVITSWTYGNQIYNKNLAKGTETAIPYINKYAMIKDRWTPEHPNTTIPGLWGNSGGGNTATAYSLFIEDGSFLRLANITMGYRFDNNLIKKVGVKSCRVYASIDNVFLWSKYSGYDPDVSVGSNQLTPGLDSDSYPRQRTFRFGINIGF